MRNRRATAGDLVALVLITAITAITACGSSCRRYPNVSQLPLVPGARVVAQVNECDPGAAAYCAIELVVRNGHYHSSDDLLLGERQLLHAHGWTGANGDIGNESAADSPGHKLHVAYATPSGELDGIDQGWISRPRPIALALSRAIFDRSPALAVLLEVGNS